MSTDGSTSTAPVTEVEFALHDPRYPFVAATEGNDCEFDLAEMVPRETGGCAEFFYVTGADPDRIVDLAAGRDSLAITLLREQADVALFEFRVAGDCPALELAELGALPREATAADGEARIVAEIPAQYDSTSIVERFLELAPDATVVSTREKDGMSPLLNGTTLEHALRDKLTPRQVEVLETAFEAGYYEWPRETTGREVACTLGITSATFSEHIHTAERKLLSMVFDRPWRGDGE